MNTDLMCRFNLLRQSIRSGERYDPVSGVGCLGAREAIVLPGGEEVYVPEAMLADAGRRGLEPTDPAWRRLRLKYDFEYWAVSCVKIKDKESGADIPFVLNTPQRRLLGVFEKDRLDGLPIRVILLKARQWGGSTLVQMYMAWIQTVHRKHWHSVICAHVKDTASLIRGMYTRMLANYPEELWDGDEAAAFVPFERSGNVRTIAGRDCRVTIGSAQNPDSIRGSDVAMAHLSETAFWPSSPMRTPRALVQAVSGAINLLPYTFVAVESTARGVGDYFHSEWLRCKAGAGDKRAVFVPWHEIDFYRLDGDDDYDILKTLNDTERGLWLHGCTTEQLRWYRRKVREFDTPEQINSEYPADDEKAFAYASGAVFGTSAVERLRAGCELEPRIGEVDYEGLKFTDDERGCLKIWELPNDRGNYVTAVDVGGRSSNADWSVIAVLDASSARPRVVAQWRGHIDHDLLAAKSIAISRFYRRAFLVIESNTLETENYGSDSNLFVLNRIADRYPNVYMRETLDSLTHKVTRRIGFHTNTATKALLIDGLIARVRDGEYIERDPEACNELLTYEQAPNGTFAARPGKHDDILMTRAIALYVIDAGAVPVKLTEPLPPAVRW